MGYLALQYDISFTPRTFYADIAILSGRAFGLQVVFDHGAFHGTGGYYTENPPFEPRELRMMANSIHVSRFIPQKTADSISHKVRKMTGGGDRKTLNRSAVVFNRVKSMNESVVKDADHFYVAIANSKKIAFRYFHRSPNREQSEKYTRGGEMLTVSPYALMWNSGFCFVATTGLRTR